MRCDPGSCPFLSQASILGALLLLSSVSPPLIALPDGETYFFDRGANAGEQERFGETSTAGDFNGDGFDDLVTGAPRATVDGFTLAGLIEVRFGGPDGLQFAPPLVLTQAQGLPGSECRTSEQGDRFGGALAAGDFDGDSLDDLAVGVIGEDAVVDGNFFEGVGAVAIFWGRADAGFDPGPCLLYGEGALPGTTGDHASFGTGLAVGDFESDGVEDLAIGAPGATVKGNDAAGTVTVIYSRHGNPLDFNTAQLWHQDVAGVAGAADGGDLLGFALATGDLVLGQDTACDLVIGIPLKSVQIRGQGAVLTLYGCTDSGLTSAGSVQLTAQSFGRMPQLDEQMGLELAVGNFDCSSADDVAIGVPRRNGALSSTGEVRVVYGNQMATPRFDVLTAEESGGGTLSSESFGRSMNTVHIDGHCDDLLVASPGRDPGFGPYNSLFYLPAKHGIELDPARLIRYELLTDSPNITLGYSLATGKFDGSRTMVAAGAPGLAVGNFDRAGRVWVLPSARIFSAAFESGNLLAWSSFVP